MQVCTHGHTHVQAVTIRGHILNMHVHTHIWVSWVLTSCERHLFTLHILNRQVIWPLVVLRWKIVCTCEESLSRHLSCLSSLVLLKKILQTPDCKSSELFAHFFSISV